MFGAEVKNGKVTVPGSANGAGEQRVSFDLAAGASADQGFLQGEQRRHLDQLE